MDADPHETRNLSGDAQHAGTVTELKALLQAYRRRTAPTPHKREVACDRTDDIELIEDMFSRLNEAVPLNAPEKHHASGGPMPQAIKAVSDHAFFKKHGPFEDRRFTLAFELFD
jgi:hypothetical protein